MKEIQLRPMQESDASAIARIYNQYIEDTWITFEQTKITDSEICNRWALGKERYPWLVALEENLLVGYAYATEWRTRASYRKSVESTIYLHADAQGKGVGTQLYQGLLDELA